MQDVVDVNFVNCDHVGCVRNCSNPSEKNSSIQQVTFQPIVGITVPLCIVCGGLTGLSDAEGDDEPAAKSAEPFIEQHYVSTPVMTPPKSATPVLTTPPPSSHNEQPAVDAALQHPPTLPVSQPPPTSKTQPVSMMDAATECVL